jgi:hypothetical protein
MTRAARKGRFSNLVLNFGGGIFYFCVSRVSVLDFIMIQQAAYHFNLVNLVGFVLLTAGLGVRLQATRTLGKYFSPTGMLKKQMLTLIKNASKKG